MEDLTIILSAISLCLVGFIGGMSYMIIRNLTERLAFFEEREAMIMDIVEKRQKGGPVKKDSLYLVGEKGPELFSPSMSGIVANTQRTADITNRAMENAMAAMKGMGQSVQNIISAPTQNVENKTENKVAIGVGTLDDNFRQLATFSF